MRRTLPVALAVLAVVVACLAGGAPLPADPPAEQAKGIAALSWLEGQWRTADGDQVWEACYSSPEGGEIVSATKQVKRGKVTLFDFERFREQDGKVILTPFPHGKASVDFVLTGFDPAVRRAVFVNEQHDFPSRMKYERVADDRLEISLAGDQDGKFVGFKIAFVRKR